MSNSLNTLLAVGQESCSGVESNGVCYTLGSGAKTFSEAGRACRQSGLNLASVTSQAAQTAVETLVGGAGVTQVWLGLSTDSKLWIWTNGELGG